MVVGQFNPRGHTFGLAITDSGWDELVDNQKIFGWDFTYNGTIPFGQESIDVNWHGHGVKVPKWEFKSFLDAWNHDSIAQISDWLARGAGTFKLDSVEDGPTPAISIELPTEIKSIRIKWHNVELKIPKLAYQNLFSARLCSPHARPVEAYVTNDRKLLYIYVSSSDASESYAVKFVFNRTGYVTRIFNLTECADEYDFLDANATCN